MVDDSEDVERFSDTKIKHSLTVYFFFITVIFVIALVHHHKTHVLVHLKQNTH